MKTKIILPILAIFLPFISNAYFDDIATTHPNFQAIQWLERNEVIEGYQTGDTQIFKSTQAVSRAAALKMLLLGSETEIESTNSTFVDVPNSQWFAPFITTATNKGIVKGFNDGKFYPAKGVTKAELLKMAIYSFDAPVNANLGQSDDTEWYKPFIEFGKQYKIIDDTENPLKPLTRGEVAEIIFRTNIVKNKKFEAPYIYSGSGLVSYYGPGFHGRPTATGEIYDSTKMTAAHRTLPFDTRVKVWIGDNIDQYVIVRISDRGPYHKTRVLDLSEKAFSELAPLSRGILEVNFEVYQDEVQKIEVPEIVKEKLSTAAQNILVPELVQEELKKKSDTRYVTEKETNEIVSGTKIFEETVNNLSETFFEKVRFYKIFPQTIRTGTVIRVSGQTVDLGHKTITFFYQPENKSQEPFEFTSTIEGREFSIQLPMTTEGTFKMGVVLDDERTSRVATINVKKGDYKRTFTRSKEIYKNELELFTKPEEKTVRLNWKKTNATNIYKLTFAAQGSNNVLKEVFIPGNEDQITLPYSFFQSFSVSGDALFVDLLEAESNDGSLFKQQSNWEKSAYKNFSIVPQFRDSESEEISLYDFKRFVDTKNQITIQGKRFDETIRINEHAYLTLPNKSIIELPINFNNAGDFDFKIKPNDWGSYVLEIIASTGKILFNRAFYVSEKTVLPVGKTNTKTVDTVSSNDISKWITEHRASNSLPALNIDSDLQQFAQKYAEQMAVDDFVGHISPTGVTFEDRINVAEFKGTYSENVAFGSNINLALAGLETSASHFSNIMNRDWNRVGIGVIQNKKGVYIAQVFGK